MDSRNDKAILVSKSVSARLFDDAHSYDSISVIITGLHYYDNAHSRDMIV